MFLTCFIVTHIELLTSDTSISTHVSNFTGLQNAPLPSIDNYLYYRVFGVLFNPSGFVEAKKQYISAL